MFYYKVAVPYGDASGRPVGDFPTFDDFEPNIDEFRIVGDLAADPVGISSIKQETVTPPPHKLQSLLTSHTTSSKRHQFYCWYHYIY